MIGLTIFIILSLLIVVVIAVGRNRVNNITMEDDDNDNYEEASSQVEDKSQYYQKLYTSRDNKELHDKLQWIIRLYTAQNEDNMYLDSYYRYGYVGYSLDYDCSRFRFTNSLSDFYDNAKNRDMASNNKRGIKIFEVLSMVNSINMDKDTNKITTNKLFEHFINSMDSIIQVDKAVKLESLKCADKLVDEYTESFKKIYEYEMDYANNERENRLHAFKEQTEPMLNLTLDTIKQFGDYYNESRRGKNGI